MLGAIACVKGRGLGKGKQSDFPPTEGWRIAPKCYIYIHAKLDFWRSQKSLIFGPIFNDFWIDFGEVFGSIFN